jgi:probable rRNA maturation factor
MTDPLDVQLANEQAEYSVDEDRLIEGCRRVLAERGIERGEVSIAVVDDARMHELNRRFLDHDYPTDVLSFVLEEDEEFLEGQLIVSAPYAAREAERFGWSAQDELLLYVIHGSLHLIGYDDQTPEAKRAMRAAERRHLQAFNLSPRYDEND